MQPSLHHDSLRDALGDDIAALGGWKLVGAFLWPDKSPDDAGRLLRHCLDPDRAEKLSLEQLQLLLRRAREVRSYAGMRHLTTECGYEPARPVEPEDERARLQREFVEAVGSLKSIERRLSGHGIRVVGGE